MEEFKKSLKFDSERYKVLISGDRIAILTKKLEDVLNPKLFVCVGTLKDYKDIFEKTKDRIIETKDTYHLSPLTSASASYSTFQLRQLQINLRPLNSAQSLLLTDSIKSKVQSVMKYPFNEVISFQYFEEFGIMQFAHRTSGSFSTIEYTIFIRDHAEYLNFIDCMAKSSGIQSVYCSH